MRLDYETMTTEERRLRHTRLELVVDTINSFGFVDACLCSESAAHSRDVLERALVAEKEAIEAATKAVIARALPIRS